MNIKRSRAWWITSLLVKDIRDSKRIYSSIPMEPISIQRRLGQSPLLSRFSSFSSLDGSAMVEEAGDGSAGQAAFRTPTDSLGSFLPLFYGRRFSIYLQALALYHDVCLRGAPILFRLYAYSQYFEVRTSFAAKLQIELILVKLCRK